MDILLGTLVIADHQIHIHNKVDGSKVYMKYIIQKSLIGATFNPSNEKYFYRMINIPSFDQFII